MIAPVYAVLASVVAAALVAACSSAPPPSEPVDLARELSSKVTADAMYQHLQKLSDIADANGRSRADGTPGYDASIDYVSQLLRDKGFDVQTPEFDRLGLTKRGTQSMTVGSRSFPVSQASMLVSTAPGGLRAETLRPSEFAGCEAGDYGSIDVDGAIAVVDDTGCSVVDKQNVATAKGAVGLLVVSDPKPGGAPPGLFTSGYYRQLTVPVGVIDSTANAALLRTTAPVRLALESKAALVKSRNVVAQTKTGDTANVVMVGAQLDSAPNSPGINDNGTGVAAVLATALALGSSPSVTNAVRFAFWGYEPGLEGATKYVVGLDDAGLNDIALYLNFDSLGSTNAGYFTYDGDQSGQPNPAIRAADVPKGSAGVERTISGYLNLAGARPADLPLTRTSDYGPFLAAGIPIGGATAGTSQLKTEAQARLWGGKAGVAFDPNDRTQRDTIDNVDHATLALMGPGVAFAVGTYAQSIDGVNGVPARDQRNRSMP